MDEAHRMTSTSRERPVIVTGGELNLNMLDLKYSADANFYQAPLHVKANGGMDHVNIAFYKDADDVRMIRTVAREKRMLLQPQEAHTLLTLARMQAS
jgi:pyruvate kinase